MLARAWTETSFITVNHALFPKIVKTGRVNLKQPDIQYHAAKQQTAEILRLQSIVSICFNILNFTSCDYNSQGHPGVPK